MTLKNRIWVVAIIVLGSLASKSEAQEKPKGPQRVLVDDFETEPRNWKFVGGEEFPGAKGSLSKDATDAHGGKYSRRLEADFGGGGAYVGVWKDLDAFQAPDVLEFRIWLKAKNVEKIGVRIVDDTGQCHQRSGISLEKSTGWQELVLKVSDLVGGEHWGGSNDGTWHGPPKAIGINIGADSLTGDDSRRGTLWLDDLTAILSPTGTPKLLACLVTPPESRPGLGTRITYRWDAQPLAKDYTAFVHLVDSTGKIVMQGDHEPPVGTRAWSGPLQYAHTIVAPTDASEGFYKIMLGLYDPKASDRVALRTGDGVVARPGLEYEIGVFRIDKNAPLPKLPPATLDLNGFKLTFDEDFREPLSVSAWGPGTRWIAHTPYGGDFGDAGFGDPEKDPPFSVADGILTISARKTGDRWRSGLLCSVDPKGAGFSQKFGYFEMRAKLPKGLGTWPAFWLMGVPQLKEPKEKKTITQIEIDVLEQYGVGPNALHTTLHLWGPGDYHWARGDTSLVTGMTDDYHTYGVLVEDEFTTFFFDGVEIRKDKTPKEAKVPLYLMIDLALGGGWPIDKTPNPSMMLVDYVRAYARK